MTSTLQNSSPKKRRFQPPITSYFTSNSTTSEENNGLSHYSYAAPTNTPTPALPGNILSSLLGVGARVRKSVPEGYKTQQKKLTAYTIPTPAVSSAKPLSDPELDITSPSTRSATQTVYAELEPFCGFHKIGNYAVQTFPRPEEDYRYGMMSVDDLETPSIPSSSQESNVSLSSSSSFHVHSNNKRALDSDAEGEEEDVSHTVFQQGGFIPGDIWQDNIAPATIGSHTSHYYTSAPSNTRSQRTILSPKLSQYRRRLVTSGSSSSEWKSRPEQENKDPLATAAPVMPHEMMDLDDFGEASFLCRREEVDADFM